jgi:hypothetical protein
MQTCEDDSAFNWIIDNRSRPVGKYDDPDWMGNPVSQVVPPIFERYVKILHSLEAHYENIDNPLSPEEVSILGIPKCLPLRELVERNRSKQSTRIRWKAVADTLGLAFEPGLTDDWFRAVMEPGCWPRFIYGPSDGWLGAEEGDSLVRILSKVTSSDSIHLRMAEVPLVATGIPLLYEGSFEDVRSLLRIGRSNMLPEYWLPRDQSWCVCSDYDLTFTLVGSSNQVCHKLLEDDVLECIEVLPGTRIDYRSSPHLLN